MDLTEDNIPEDSPLYTETYKPRGPRARGGNYSFAERDHNSVCIFVAADDFGHTIARFVGIGAASKNLLERVAKDRILQKVPKERPKQRAKKHQILPKSGDASLLISDGEKAIATFAKRHGIAHEAHIYRKGNQQLRLGKADHDIQRVNAIHSRLKLFLLKTNYVSTKYLPGFLTFFEWKENTKATEDAILQLFRILATPGLGPPSSFFKERYTIPNYYLQLLQENNPLRKIPQNKLLAFHLYKQRVEALERGEEDTAISMEEIAYQTDYDARSIRRIYQNMRKSGLEACIEQYFAKEESQTVHPHAPQARQSASPEMLTFFDEYRENLLAPKMERLTFVEFANAMNAKYGSSVTDRRLKYSFKYIVDHGLRAPLPKRTTYRESGDTSPALERAFQTEKAYLALKKKFRVEGKPIPPRDKLLRLLSEELGIKASTIDAQLDTCSYAKKSRRERANPEDE